MIGKVMKTPICIIIIQLGFLLLSVAVHSEEIPQGVYEAAQEGLRSWLNLCQSDYQIFNEVFGDSDIDVSESCLGMPYTHYLISSEELLRYNAEVSMLSLCDVYGYVFPIIFGDNIVAFLTVRYLFVVEEGVERWYLSGVRLGLERERDYYSLINEYPESEVYTVSYEWPSKMFFLVISENDKYMIRPASKYFADIVGLQLHSNEFHSLNQIMPLLLENAEIESKQKVNIMKENLQWQAE